VTGPVTGAVVVERRGKVATLRVDRPRVNALSLSVLAELHEAVRGLTADLPGALVVTGTGRVFSAGADISELTGPERAADFGQAFAAALGALAALPRVTIAAIAGPALGGGLELALACDLRVAAEGARLGLPEVLLGVIPGGGGTQRLARLVGPARAKELLLTGRYLDAQEALGLGLVDKVVPPGDLLEEASALAARFADGAVLAQGLAKRAVDEGSELPLAEGLQLERELFVEVFKTRDAATGVRSFLERGPGQAEYVGE
jgi:enoyl-CoA hydratase/carnithine racemase